MRSPFRRVHVVAAIIIVVIVVAATFVYYVEVYNPTRSSPTTDVEALTRLSSEAERNTVRSWIEEAKSEGQMVYVSNQITPDTNAKLADAFKNFTGLDIEIRFSELKSGPLSTMIEGELEAGKVTHDVIHVSDVPWFLDLENRGEIAEWNNPNEGQYGSLVSGMKNPGYWVSDIYCFSIAYNHDKISQELKSFRDVINPAFDGKIVIRDISTSPTAIQNYIGLRKVLPRSYFEELAKLHPIFVSGSEARHAMLASGESWVTTEGTPFDVYSYQQQGVNLEFVYAQEGVVLFPRPFVVLAGAPHPNLARLWVYFMTSELGQSTYVKYGGITSGRSDFVSPVPELFPPVSTLTEKAINFDLQEITQAEMDSASNEFKEIFNIP